MTALADGSVDKVHAALQAILHAIGELFTNDERVGLPGDVTIEIAPFKAVC